MAEQSERSRLRAQRFANFQMSALVREDNPTTRLIYEAVSSAKLNKEQKRKLKEARARANAIAAAQRVAGSGLYVDTYLRHFVQEYNGRIFAGEGIHMPNSYNVMRAMVEPDEKAMVLKLHSQEENVMSFSRMLDHITNPKVDTSLRAITPFMEEFKIYEINMLGGHAQFRVPSLEEYVFCGMAACRESSEISLVGVFGRTNDDPKKGTEKLDPNNIYPGKKFLYNVKSEIDVSDEALFGDAGYVPIILMSVIDTSNGKVQVRYVMEEKKDVFNVLTDNAEDMEWLLSRSDSSSCQIENILERFDELSPLFELMFAVPSCLELMADDETFIERHPTQLKLNPRSRDARCASKLSIAEAPKYVTVNRLYDLGEAHKNTYEIRPSNLKIETSGYWKTLQLGATGRDRFGNPVQGKTWVSTQISWFEMAEANSQPYERPAEIDTSNTNEETGYVYVMRNAMHSRDIYKVGFTTKTTDERATQLGATSGQPDQFNVVQSWYVRHPKTIEYEIHQVLKDYRVNDRREFFKLKYERIRSTIESIIDRAKAELPDPTANSS